MKSICLFTNGVLPVPPTQGGAVENLIKLIIDRNEESQDAELFVTSIYDSDALNESRKYMHCNFYFVKIPAVIRFCDKLIFILMKTAAAEKSVSFRMILGRLYYIQKSKRYFLRHDFDRIVAENHASLFLVMKDKRMMQKYRDTFYYHAHNEPNGTFSCRKQICQCTKILCVSEFIKASWKRTYPEASAQYDVVKNGVNTDLFCKELSEEERLNLRIRMGFSSDDFVIIFAGRLSAEKGILQLARAFVNLDVPGKKLLIAGGAFFTVKIKSPVQNELTEILAPCMKNVFFTGFVKYDEIWKYYKAADTAVLPSIWDEPALLTNIEAQLCGLPVISTLSGGIPEYANPDAAILLPVDSHLEENLTAKIAGLYENSRRRKAIGMVNKKFAGQFSGESFYRQFISAAGGN